jgi:hypothetical protein
MHFHRKTLIRELNSSIHRKGGRQREKTGKREGESMGVQKEGQGEREPV